MAEIGQVRLGLLAGLGGGILLAALVLWRDAHPLLAGIPAAMAAVALSSSYGLLGPWVYPQVVVSVRNRADIALLSVAVACLLTASVRSYLTSRSEGASGAG